MKMRTTEKKILCNLLALCFLASGCLSSDIPTGATRNLDSSQVNENNGTDGLTDGAFGAIANPSTLGQGTTLPPKVEIRHLIEPNITKETDPTYSSGTGYIGGGSYKKKLTLPKNFQGRLYVAGVNVVSLADRHIRVRFRFGMNREPITIPATVVQAPGITPFTSIHVLVLDMRSEPFRNIRLPYDLFDYNTYDFDPDSTSTTELKEPTQDNRNPELFCRGLKVEDDSTYNGTDGICDGTPSTEECKYAYAKILDQGPALVSGDNLIPTTPTLPQVQTVTDKNYYDDSFANMLKKPLVNDLTKVIVSKSYYFKSSSKTSFNWEDHWQLSDAGKTYQFDGPYRPVNIAEWEFKDPTIHGANKLFMKDSVGVIESDDGSTLLKSPWCVRPTTLTTLPQAEMKCTESGDPLKNILYYNSYLFPLATQLNLQKDVHHLSHENVLGGPDANPKTAHRISDTTTSGKTLWMDGVNARVISRNSDDEHIGSCNVSAVIEILARDLNANDFIVASTKDVKLQLVRPILHNTDYSNNDVLYTNFKRCESNLGCGAGECCFNKRCWDEDLASQCFDDNSILGNKNTGESCNSDLECSSLCCNDNSGKCAPHNSTISPPVSCGKVAGNRCITTEWCAKVEVTRCYIIKTGTDAMGTTTCRQHCYKSMEHGDCIDGYCQNPYPVFPGAFDPNAPGACDDAVTPPRF